MSRSMAIAACTLELNPTAAAVAMISPAVRTLPPIDGSGYEYGRGKYHMIELEVYDTAVFIRLLFLTAGACLYSR